MGAAGSQTEKREDENGWCASAGTWRAPEQGGASENKSSSAHLLLLRASQSGGEEWIDEQHSRVEGLKPHRVGKRLLRGISSAEGTNHEPKTQDPLHTQTLTQTHTHSYVCTLTAVQRVWSTRLAPFLHLFLFES